MARGCISVIRSTGSMTMGQPAPVSMTAYSCSDFAYCPGDAIVKDRYENVCDCAEGAVADVIFEKIPPLVK